MTTVSIRDLRLSFPKVEALLLRGEDVWISRRGKTFARLSLETPPPTAKDTDPNARFRARFGPDAEWKPMKLNSGGSVLAALMEERATRP